MRQQQTNVAECQEGGGGSKRNIGNCVAIILIIAFTNCTWAFEEGDWCINDGEEGVCRPVHQCPEFVSRLPLTHIVGPSTPGLCFYKESQGAVVCCPLEERTTTIDYRKYFPGKYRQDTLPTDDAEFLIATEKNPAPLRTSERKCLEYEQEILFDCDKPPMPVAYIVGGENAIEGEYPHMAALGYLYKQKGSVLWQCGGTLISHQYVLTAAHCRSSTWGELIVVRLGRLYVQETSWRSMISSVRSRSGNSGDHPVASIITHPDYSSFSVYNDIALVRLAEPIRRFDQLVQPACLNTIPETSENVEATGWGSTKFGGDDIEIRPLLHVQLKIYDIEDCAREYSAESKTMKLRRGIDDNILCAGWPTGGRDTCQGDSGGPIQVKNTTMGCLYRIVGVTSLGKVCGSSYFPNISLYIRVSSYLSWIESIVWPEKNK